MNIYAFDLWGVILDPSQPDLNNPRVYEPGAIESIAKIVNAAGPENCFIVSLIKISLEDKHRQALHEDKIFEKTGLLAENAKFINYSLHKPSKAATIKELGITHFVDDQLRFLVDLPANTKRFWYNRRKSLVDKFLDRGIHHATQDKYPFFKNWDDLYKKLSG